MERLLGPLLDTSYPRYLLASAASLGADLFVFITGIYVGMPPLSAAVIGYSCGLALHWMLSSRFVFLGAARSSGPEKLRQQCLFIASALAGLGITTGIIGCGLRYGLDPRIAKLIALCVSFQATYLIRSKVVFS